MFRKTIFTAVALAVAVLQSQSAHAVSYTFDLTGGGLLGSTAPSFTVFDTTNAISLLVTGFDEDGSADVYRNSLGMGVYSGGIEDPLVDGFGPDETLRLTFPTSLDLDQAVFSFRDRDDTFTLSLDGSYLGQAGIPVGGVFDFSGVLLATIFDFGVTDFSDEYLLRSVTLSGNFNEVPEPATMLLLGSGIAALAARRRKVA